MMKWWRGCRMKWWNDEEVVGWNDEMMKWLGWNDELSKPPWRNYMTPPFTAPLSIQPKGFTPKMPSEVWECGFRGFKWLYKPFATKPSWESMNWMVKKSNLRRHNLLFGLTCGSESLDSFSCSNARGSCSKVRKSTTSEPPFWLMVPKFPQFLKFGNLFFVGILLSNCTRFPQFVKFENLLTSASSLSHLYEPSCTFTKLLWTAEKYPLQATAPLRSKIISKETMGPRASECAVSATKKNWHNSRNKNGWHEVFEKKERVCRRIFVYMNCLDTVPPWDPRTSEYVVSSTKNSHQFAHKKNGGTTFFFRKGSACMVCLRAIFVLRKCLVAVPWKLLHNGRPGAL